MPLGVTEVRGGTDSDEFDKVPKGRRKRKIESVNGDDDEEARKKARGRPRVDPKDETAADVSFSFFAFSSSTFHEHLPLHLEVVSEEMHSSYHVIALSPSSQPTSIVLILT